MHTYEKVLFYLSMQYTETWIKGEWHVFCAQWQIFPEDADEYFSLFLINMWCFNFIFVFEAQSVMLVQIVPNLIPQICWYAFFCFSLHAHSCSFYFLGIVSSQHICRSAVAIQYCCLKVLDFLRLEGFELWSASNHIQKIKSFTMETLCVSSVSYIKYQCVLTYLGGTQFGSGPWHWLLWPRCLMDFLGSSREMQDSTFKQVTGALVCCTSSPKYPLVPVYTKYCATNIVSWHNLRISLISILSWQCIIFPTIINIS
jgi:hypothetical protein